MKLATLLKSRRFLPFFATQFLGAFNDNLLKQTVILSIMFYMAGEGDSHALINLGAFLFIVPFFLLSAWGGTLGERIEKSRLIKSLKLLELGVMALASVGLMLDSVSIMLLALFATGVQSALFGPVKYALLPQHLKPNELVAGNALVETGTFLAILVGTLAAGVMMAESDYRYLISLSLLVVGLLGLLSSLLIPKAPSLSTEAGPITFGVIKPTMETLKVGFGQKLAVSRSLLGNSWFWFIGAIYLTQIPAMVKLNMGGDETAVSAMLVAFSIGIAVGSLLCEKLSYGKVEIGLVPLGSVGLTVFGLLLYYHLNHFQISELPLDWKSMLESPLALLVLLDISMLGVCGGLYIVPLYALIQSRSEPGSRSRVIAAANILNALFMVIASALSVVVLSVLQWSIPTLLLVVAVLNAGVNAYLFKIVPEFIIRFMIWSLSHTIYRVRHQGLENIPDEGSALLICNHVSFVDALIIMGAVKRPIRFVMYYKIFRWPILSFIFKWSGAVPIAGKNEDIELYEKAFDKIAHLLEQGELVCIFPEGRLSSDGNIGKFMPGARKILDRTPVPVIPMALNGLWESFFSRAPTRKPFKRIWSRVELVSADALPANTSTEQMRETVGNLIAKELK